jgi:hypothetical protein
MNRRGSNLARGSRVSIEDLILQLVLAAAVLAAWVVGFASLGGM